VLPKANRLLTSKPRRATDKGCDLGTDYVYIVTNCSPARYTGVTHYLRRRVEGWLRAKKIALIESFNPAWRDLSEDWDEGLAPQTGSRETLRWSLAAARVAWPTGSG
jgi:hypothetical protein